MLVHCWWLRVSDKQGIIFENSVWQFQITANLLLSTFFPEITDKTSIIFSDIENKVLDGSFDAGLLIHEGRFTYSQKGLVKLFDLGEVWEAKMSIPLPLGCITAKRSIDEQERTQISGFNSSQFTVCV